MKFKLAIAAVLVGSALLTACGKSGGGGSNASTPATSFAGAPAGYIGNGTWSGTVAIPSASLPVYYQMAALTGLCYQQGCQQSYFRIQVTLQSGNGYQPYINGQPQTQVAVQTQAAFRLIGANGSFTRQNVYITGGSASFSMSAGLYTQQPQYQGATPVAPVAGEPVVTVNGQFTDATQSVLNVQVLYQNQQVATGQIFCSGNVCGGQVGGGYPYGNPYMYGNANYYGNPYQQGGNPYYSTGTNGSYGGGYIQVGGYWYPLNRR